jgi:hypothetical protein
MGFSGVVDPVDPAAYGKQELGAMLARIATDRAAAGVEA